MIEEILITQLDPRQVKQLDAADKASLSNPECGASSTAGVIT